ncbi:MAG: PCMD domain-containing protein [Tannerellaceae bacterium]|nr:PCMD domain-containing protein [Tannerellaceae bacterium]
MKTKVTLAVVFTISLLWSGCIENDVDYPYVGGIIDEFEVEGMVRSATINRTTRTVEAEVSDKVDLYNLTITRLKVENNASIFPDATKCIDATAFPEKGFASLDSIPETANTKVNFSTPVNFLIQTYQDYDWTVTVTQELEQYFLLDGDVQTKEECFDNDARIVYVFVEEGTDLSNLVVDNVQFVSPVETLSPEPWDVTDFRQKVEFQVTVFGRTEVWSVYVVHEDEVEMEASAFPRTTQAVISGTCRINTGTEFLIEYKRINAKEWIAADGQVEVVGNNFTTLISGLSPRVTYNYRITVDGKVYEEEEFEFTTAHKEDLPNGSFDEWHLEGNRIQNPWARTGTQFWDTGNRGATIAGGNSNTVPDNQNIVTVSGYSAKLESLAVFGIKLAAGSIFTGRYVETDGTNGILSFGRSFKSFPTKLKFSYKYTSATINRSDDSSNSPSKPAMDALLCRPDSCHVYWALADWEEPWEIRTKYSVRQLFEPDDEGIIAYGEFISGETTTDFQSVIKDFEYRANRVPRYLVIVATSSKYGDYFTGGTGSTLWLDEMELLYD